MIRILTVLLVIKSIRLGDVGFSSHISRRSFMTVNQKLLKDAKFKRKEEAKAAKEIVPAASTTPAPVAPTEPSADVAMRAEIMAFREELRALAQAKQGFESVPTESGFLSVEDTPDAEPEYCFHACGHTADQCLALTPAASGGDYVTTFNCPKTTLPQLPEMEITMTDSKEMIRSTSLLQPTLSWLLRRHQTTTSLRVLPSELTTYP